ncbi:MAG TPA: sortase [Candidatus Saccharimonadales bacterium]|nr:sortase [Candidatus Saccharimonadales bacterium]
MAIDKRILLVRTIGNFLILSALAGIFFTFYPVITAFTSHELDNLQGKKFEASQTSSPTQSFGNLLGDKQSNPAEILIPKDPNFDLIVEKIGANAVIVPNVDASNKDVYTEALKRGVAHALGTSFPGQPGVTYLFAHSTDTLLNVPRYNAIFYLLWDLKPQDKVVVFFNGKRYDYLVTETKITNPDDVSYFTMRTPEQILVLQTCYPPGTTWKRLLVVAKPAFSQTSSAQTALKTN